MAHEELSRRSLLAGVSAPLILAQLPATAQTTPARRPAGGRC
jgi:hypothetical protein